MGWNRKPGRSCSTSMDAAPAITAIDRCSFCSRESSSSRTHDAALLCSACCTGTRSAWWCFAGSLAYIDLYKGGLCHAVSRRLAVTALNRTSTCLLTISHLISEMSGPSARRLTNNINFSAFSREFSFKISVGLCSWTMETS